VSDLSPLNGMPLTHLNCYGTKVGDASLAQIRNCKDLAVLVLSDTSVSDAGLANLAEFKTLNSLNLVRSKVSDMAPIQGLTLEDIRLTPGKINARGFAVLRKMKTLKSIGTDWNSVWPAAEFWARYDKGEFTKQRGSLP
jgi:Leucine-rich repeat (LRR) protein